MADKDNEQGKTDEAEAARKAEEARFAEIANRAAADHAKRLASKYDKTIEERDAVIAQLRGEVESLKKGGAPREPAETGKQANEQANVEALRKEFDARLRERDAKLEEERKAREAEHKARLEQEEKQATLAALADAEVSTELREAARLMLREGKRIARDEGGELVFLIPKDGYTDKVPLAQGIKAWADSTEGKVFQAPRGVAGSGNKPTQKGGKGGSANTRAEKLAEAKAALASAFWPGRGEG